MAWSGMRRKPAVLRGQGCAEGSSALEWRGGAGKRLSRRERAMRFQGRVVRELAWQGLEDRASRFSDTMNEPVTVCHHEVVVELKSGLHMAPAVQVVQTAQKFRASLSIRKGERVVDGKSMFDLLTLAAEQGSRLELETRGEDAPEALAAVVALFARNFVVDGVSADRDLVP